MSYPGLGRAGGTQPRSLFLAAMCTPTCKSPRPRLQLPSPPASSCGRGKKKKKGGGEKRRDEKEGKKEKERKVGKEEADRGYQREGEEQAPGRPRPWKGRVTRRGGSAPPYKRRCGARARTSGSGVGSAEQSGAAAAPGLGSPRDRRQAGEVGGGGEAVPRAFVEGGFPACSLFARTGRHKARGKKRIKWSFLFWFCGPAWCCSLCPACQERGSEDGLCDSGGSAGDNSGAFLCVYLFFFLIIVLL